MKVIVCGSRTFDDYKLLDRKLTRILSRCDNKKLTIVTGAAKGADKLADAWAGFKFIARMRFHPDHAKHGKSAPIIRNAEMLKESRAKVCIAFWDGKSKGTKDILDRARKAGLTIRIIYF